MYEKTKGKIAGKAETFSTYEEMRDVCYEFVSKDKDFVHCGSGGDSWCTDCARDKSWS